jgi:hypothetical protein
MKLDPIPIRNLDNLPQIRRRREWPDLLQIILEAPGSDRDQQPSRSLPGIAKGMDAASLSISRLSRNKREPLPVRKKFEATIKGHEGLVFVGMTMRRWTSAGEELPEQA